MDFCCCCCRRRTLENDDDDDDDDDAKQRHLRDEKEIVFPIVLPLFLLISPPLLVRVAVVNNDIISPFLRERRLRERTKMKFLTPLHKTPLHSKRQSRRFVLQSTEKEKIKKENLVKKFPAIPPVRIFETLNSLLLLHQNATEIHAHVASNADLNNNNNNNNGSREQRDGRTNTGA